MGTSVEYFNCTRIIDTDFRNLTRCQTRIGTGEGSDVINTRTKGSAPAVPDANRFIEGSASSVTLHLSAWSDGGCPMLYFVVEYRGKYVTSCHLII